MYFFVYYIYKTFKQWAIFLAVILKHNQMAHMQNQPI